MPRVASLVAAVLLLGVLPLAPAEGGTTAAAYLVGYDPAEEDAALLVIKAAGGHVHRTSPELGFAVASSDSPDLFEQALAASPYIDYVELDDPTRIDGGQWNGGQWNVAEWDGAQWNGGQWNGGQWNGAQWNDNDLKDVSEAQRLAAKWTERHFEQTSDTKMQFAGDMTDPGLVWQWGPWATRAPDGWVATATGSGSASLCVLDSGVAWDHGDIAPNFADAYNAMNASRSAYDDGGHGTHIAGIAAGALANGWGVAGVANVRILSAKVLDGNGTGHESDLAFGLVWCANQRADVAVMALSVTEADHPTLQRALAYAAQRDVLMLASAGNTGGDVQFPARHPDVVAVSAVDGDLALAAFSSRGAEVELAAPGVHALGPFPGGAFVFGSGTSQAVAYAAGLAALVRDVAPSLSAEEARALLQASATDVGEPGVDASFGHGLVHVEAALAAATA